MNCAIQVTFTLALLVRDFGTKSDPVEEPNAMRVAQAMACVPTPECNLPEPCSNRPDPVLAALGGLALLLALAGCGGSVSAPVTTPANPGTPAGTYTLTLKATAASGLSHTTTWRVTVH